MPGATQLITQVNSASKTFCILIADQDRVVRETCRQAGEELGFTVLGAEEFTTTVRQLSVRAVDLVLLEIGLPGAEMAVVLSSVKALQPAAELVLTGQRSRVESVVEAIKGGAYDFLGKPFKNEEYMRVLQRVAARRALWQESLARSAGNGRLVENAMVGQSPEMLRLYRIIERTASSKHPILILGEKGTGKSSMARLIHAGGVLRDRPFVEVNCSALSPSQLEAVLFGSPSGSDQPALANRSTLFVKSVAEMPLAIQGRLFRALQEKEIRPPGASKTLPVEARVIAATGRDLDVVVQQGTFRRDLYLRLNVVALRLPPLRERREDIPALAEHFLRRIPAKPGAPFSLSPEALKMMLAYSWPGNVRELENVMRHATSVSSGTLLTPSHLPHEIQARNLSERPASEPGRILPLAEVERKAILDTLHQLNGNKQMAAQMLGIGKTTLYRKLKEYGISRRGMDRHLRP